MNPPYVRPCTHEIFNPYFMVGLQIILEVPNQHLVRKALALPSQLVMQVMVSRRRRIVVPWAHQAKGIDVDRAKCEFVAQRRLVSPGPSAQSRCVWLEPVARDWSAWCKPNVRRPCVVSRPLQWK